MGMSARQKLNRNIRGLTNVMTQMDLTFDISTKEHTFFSEPHETFSKIDHIPGNKAKLNRYEKNEVCPCILSYHHGLKLEFNNINFRKSTN